MSFLNLYKVICALNFLVKHSFRSDLLQFYEEVLEITMCTWFLQSIETRSRSRRFRSKLPPWCQHPAKFSDHKSCESGDIVFAIFLVTNMMSRDFKDWSLAWKATTLPSFVLIGLLQMQIRCINLSRDITNNTWVKDNMTEWEFIAVYHHPGKFGDHRHCALRDSVILICQMTSQKHAFKVSCHVMVSHYPVKFGGHRHCGRRDMFLICHMISQDHMTQ